MFGRSGRGWGVPNADGNARAPAAAWSKRLDATYCNGRR